LTETGQAEEGSEMNKPKWQRARHLRAGAIVWIKCEKPHLTIDGTTGKPAEFYSVNVQDHKRSNSYGLYGVPANHVELLAEFAEDVAIHKSKKAWSRAEGQAIQ
jgi:hypothetical protein